MSLPVKLLAQPGLDRPRRSTAEMTEVCSIAVTIGTNTSGLYTAIVHAFPPIQPQDMVLSDSVQRLRWQMLMA